MRLSKEKRKFIAENAAEVAKYILSIVILGQIISTSISWRLIIGSGFQAVPKLLFRLTAGFPPFDGVYPERNAMESKGSGQASAGIQKCDAG